VAAERALLTDMGVLTDPFAHTMLSPSMTAILGVLQHLPPRFPARSVTLAGLAARVLWFDSQVAGALDSSITQIALIGAGYDSRAWRFSSPGVRFFEVDHGATQKDKTRRAPGTNAGADARSGAGSGAGPVYVEADLRTDCAVEALADHGLDPSRPALFVVEGVTMYLDEEVVRHQLAALGESSAPGSRLAVDFLPPPQAGTARNHRQNQLQRLARSGSGETFKLTIGPAEAVELVTVSGWDVTEATSLRDAARSRVPPGSGLPVDAVNDHKTLVAASRA
jgi:methyltransferase (TIGR00027 family)